MSMLLAQEGEMPEPDERYCFQSFESGPPMTSELFLARIRTRGLSNGKQFSLSLNELELDKPLGEQVIMVTK